MGRLIDADALYTLFVKMKSFGELTAKKAIRCVEEAPTVDAIPVEWIKNYINRTNDTDGYAVAEMLSEWEEDDEQPSSDACDQISELVIERLKAEKILEQLGQNLGEVFGKIAETILKEEGKKNG